MRLMVQTLGITLVLAVGTSWAEEKKALESNHRGWVDLLPDQSFKGWTRVAIPPTRPLQAASPWSVDTANRVILCEANRGHEWLRYDRELSDFIFQVEWRFQKLEGTKGYNSGIYIRTSPDGIIWHQAEVGSGNGGYLFGYTPVNDALRRFNLKPQMKERRDREAGEWNTYEVRCEGRAITLSVNGGVTSELTTCDVPKGYLGLEAEGSRIEFQDLKLKELR